MLFKVLEGMLNTMINLIYSNFRDQTFIHKHEPSKDDEKTQEALKLFEDENRIFTTIDLPPTTFLPRFDLEACDEKDLIPEIVERCQARPDKIHGLSPTYENYEYVWRPVYVLGYENNRWKVKVFATGQIKSVTRLSLVFFDENSEQFLKRVKNCKTLQKKVDDEILFTNLVDSISSGSVSILSKEQRFNILKKSMREKNDIGRKKVAETFKQLLRVVEEEYIRQMKKFIVLKDFQNHSSHEKFQELKIPLRLPSRSARYLGVVPIPKYEFDSKFQDFSIKHWSKNAKQVSVTEKLVIRSLKLCKQRFM